MKKSVNSCPICGEKEEYFSNFNIVPFLEKKENKIISSILLPIYKKCTCGVVCGVRI